jgi:hypothetical protein
MQFLLPRPCSVQLVGVSVSMLADDWVKRRTSGAERSRRILPALSRPSAHLHMLMHMWCTRGPRATPSLLLPLHLPSSHFLPPSLPHAHTLTMTVDTPAKFPGRAHAAKLVAELVKLIPEGERSGVSRVATVIGPTANLRNTPSSCRATPRPAATTLTASCPSVRSLQASKADRRPGGQLQLPDRRTQCALGLGPRDL